jgi:hypothetical protein
VHEHVLAAVIGDNEAETLFRAEPFDGAFDGRGIGSAKEGRSRPAEGAGRRGGAAAAAALASTSSTPVTWRPFCPWATWTFIRVPGSTESCPALCSTAT